MATTTQLNGLRALIRDLKYLLAFLALIAFAATIFLATVYGRVTTDVLIGMMLCLGLIFFCAGIGWFVLLRDPRLRFLFPELPAESRGAAFVRAVVDFCRRRPARSLVGAPAGDGALNGDIELTGFRPARLAGLSADDAVARLEEGTPESAQLYTTTRLRDVRGQ